MTTDNLSNHQRILRGIAAKQALRPKVDNQGHPVGEETVTHQYDEHGRPIDQG